MLAVSVPLRAGSNGDDERDGEMENFSMLDDFSNGALLEDINFDDFFVGFDDGDILPELEVDPAEIFTEFSAGAREEDSGTMAMAVESAERMVGVDGLGQELVVSEEERREEKEASQSEDAVSAWKKEDPVVVPSSEVSSSSSPDADRGRKSSSAAAKASQGKRKVKVDWSPELHRRFVQAVEQLGVDKAVPSRILELMGMDCLTRHNIASHLQKYRSHRKHLLAREAEAASWSQRRQMYAASATGMERDINIHPWLAPVVGFPHPPPPPPPPRAVQPLWPFHVWGHPTVDPQLVRMWPRHLAPLSPTPPWASQPPLPPPADPSYWHHHFQRGSRQGWVPHALTQGTLCFPQPFPTARFPAPAVPGILSHPMPRPVPPPLKKHSISQTMELDAQPSKESIDAAIGDALAKPWLPLPLGLKPPSLDGVLLELQKQGISKVPPACS